MDRLARRHPPVVPILMQPDNPAVSCRGEADVFEADTFEVEGDHKAVIYSGNDAYFGSHRLRLCQYGPAWRVQPS